MTIRVFVSHKNTDIELARLVASRLNRNGLPTYLDQVDDSLLRDSPDLADHLLNRMSECNQLIAVVSVSTKDSWWVPWEIGVGSEKRFRMATYSANYVDLPSYLRKWPALKSVDDLDLYCALSKTYDSAVNSRTRFESDQRYVRSVERTEASNFHRQLMTSLRR